MRALGAGYWLARSERLREVADRVARAQYTLHRDPDEAALWYLALGKRGPLVALYKVAKNDKLVDFLSNDFEAEERWRTAALKNAYVLVSKRNWPLAVAFFILAAKWQDAAAICDRSMGDPQLGLVIAALAPRRGADDHLGRYVREVLIAGEGGGDEEGASWRAYFGHLVLGDSAAALEALGHSCDGGRGEGHFAPSALAYCAWLGGKADRAAATVAQVPRAVAGAAVYAYEHAGCALAALSAADHVAAIGGAKGWDAVLQCSGKGPAVADAAAVSVAANALYGS